MYQYNHTALSLSEKVLNKYKSNIFFETGTNLGFGIEIAINCAYKKIYEINNNYKIVYEDSHNGNGDILVAYVD